MQSQDTGNFREYPAALRDEVISQMTVMKSKFQNYRKYANATMQEVLTPEDLKDALRLKSSNLSSSFCRNEGNGRFSLFPLPYQLQLSAVNGMVADDFNADGKLDLIINTNDYSTDVSLGRYDALNGLALAGDGKGSFKPLDAATSGIFIPGNGKSLVRLRNAGGAYLVAASQNRGPLKLYELKVRGKQIAILPGEESAELVFRDGTKQKTEFYSGSSFLSQSSRFIHCPPGLLSVVIKNNKGGSRKISL
jgi:hypothetical protein